MPRKSCPRPDYQASVWMNTVLKESLLAEPSTHETSEFRRPFQLPFPFYKKLVEECKRERWCGRLGSGDAVGRASIPVEVKLLVVLQILGRGNSFDDIEMVSGIVESKVQACFHTFCKIFAKGMYKAWISAPEGEDLKEVTATYTRLGFPCAVGSCNVTHVRWDKAPASRTVYYTGKEGLQEQLMTRPLFAMTRQFIE
ncbi:unnamed protein product [Discosporangium mesarthrocarpum]